MSINALTRERGGVPMSNHEVERTGFMRGGEPLLACRSCGFNGGLAATAEHVIANQFQAKGFVPRKRVA